MYFSLCPIINLSYVTFLHVSYAELCRAKYPDVALSRASLSCAAVTEGLFPTIADQHIFPTPKTKQKQHKKPIDTRCIDLVYLHLFLVSLPPSLVSQMTVLLSFVFLSSFAYIYD